MRLAYPLLISAALRPAVRIGDDWIDLMSIAPDGDRDRATFEIRTPDFIYLDDSLRSGCGGFGHTNEDCVRNAFESFLSFLDACQESGEDGENSDLFPTHVREWAHQYSDEIGTLAYELSEEGTE